MDRYLEEIEKIRTEIKEIENNNLALEEEYKDLKDKFNNKIANEIKVTKLNELKENVLNLICDYETMEKKLKKTSKSASIFVPAGIILFIIANLISWNIVLQLLALFFIVNGLSNSIKVPKLKKCIYSDIRSFNILIDSFDKNLTISDKNVVNKIEQEIVRLSDDIVLNDKEMDKMVMYSKLFLQNMSEITLANKKIRKIEEDRNVAINLVIEQELEKGTFDDLISEEYVKKLGVRK